MGKKRERESTREGEKDSKKGGVEWGRMDKDNGEIYDVCTGRDATALKAVMIEPCTEKKTCLQNVELPLSVAIISVCLTQALIRRVILEKINPVVK